MKHTLKVMAFILCLALVFTTVLTGCGNEKPLNDTSETPTESKNPSEKSQDVSYEASEAINESQEESSETSEMSDESREESSAVPDTSEEPVEEPAEPLDMDAFIEEIASEHPSANAEELCAEIQKSPYFVLYQLINIEYYIPGFSFDYKPVGVENSYALVHKSTESFVLVFKTSPGTDTDKLVSELKENAVKDWGYNGESNDPDTVFAKTIDGTVFFALYHSDIQPITVYAKTPEEYVDIFRDYCRKHTDADCKEIASYLSQRQNFNNNNLNAHKVSEGELKGFGEFDGTTITGFSDGVVFCPDEEPSDFLGYVFRVTDGNSVDSFVSQLRKKANLAFNMCIILKNLTVEAEGNYVLFMMHGVE